MSVKPISPLRRRMIEDMTARGVGGKTQSDHIRHVKSFTIFLGRSPDTATPEEVLLLLEAAQGPRDNAALAVAYGAGLRVSEVVSLKVSDIDSARMVLRIEQGKGPKAVLAYLARYTHRVAISSRRLVAVTDNSVTFKVKDYRVDGPGRYRTMTVHPHEFIRRLLIHVLPKGFHRIRHYGLLANSEKDECLGRARELLAVEAIDPADDDMRCEAEREAVVDTLAAYPCPCPRCGARLIIIATFDGACPPRPRPQQPACKMRIDTS